MEAMSRKKRTRLVNSSRMMGGHRGPPVLCVRVFIECVNERNPNKPDFSLSLSQRAHVRVGMACPLMRARVRMCVRACMHAKQQVVAMPTK